MSIVLEVIDKTGRIIYLTSERLTHILKHPEMTNKIDHIKETLQQPTRITQFSYDSAVRFYYRYYKDIKQYLFISVKYLNGKGFIITSFYVDSIK